MYTYVYTYIHMYIGTSYLSADVFNKLRDRLKILEKHPAAHNIWEKFSKLAHKKKKIRLLCLTSQRYGHLVKKFEERSDFWDFVFETCQMPRLPVVSVTFFFPTIFLCVACKLMCTHVHARIEDTDIHAWYYWD